MEVLAVPFQKLAEGITFLGKSLGDLVQNIVNGIGDLLKMLFVPETSPFEEVAEKLRKKFGFIFQIQEMIQNLLGFNNYGNSVPVFRVNLYGNDVAIIDFSVFLNYRLWLHGIILAFAWFAFIRKTFVKLPSIIGGFSQ